MRRAVLVLLATAAVLPCWVLWRYGDAPAQWAVLPWIYVACGSLARYTQPHNRTGALMIWTGVAFYVDLLQFDDEAGFRTLGLSLGLAYVPLFAHMILAFPSGRLVSTGARTFVAGVWAYVIVFGTGGLLFRDPASSACSSCPLRLNLFVVRAAQERPNQVDRLSEELRELPLPLILTILLVLIGVRWSRATPAARRALASVFPPAIVFVLTSLMQDVARAGIGLDGIYHRYPHVEPFVRELTLLAGVAVPVGFLVGLARDQRRRARVGQLMVELDELRSFDHLETALGRALGDPSLRFGRWDPAHRRYVTSDGEVLTLPAADSDRSSTLLERDGTPLAAIVHDPVLLEEPGLLGAVNAATRLAVDNDRLQSELRGQLEETRASRARIATAADDARRRLERDLHDGVQQRLVTLAMDVRLVQAGLRDPVLRASLGAIGDEMAITLQELRDFARGVHPAVLTEEGLPAALTSLAERFPLPVRISATMDHRLPAAHEAAAYFVVSEALTNIAKHSHATRAGVRASTATGVLEVEVVDDGVGGAVLATGSGLSGLDDRVAALDGVLTITSGFGQGTTVRASIPLLATLPTAPPSPPPGVAAPTSGRW